MLRFRSIILLIALHLCCFAAAQEMPIRRTIVVRDTALTQQFEVLVQPRHIQPRPGKLYHSFRNDKIMITESDYVGTVLDGVYIATTQGGILVEKGMFTGGLKTGAWLSWYTWGKLRKKEHWKAGVLYGQFEAYTENGQISEKGQYKRGLLDGTVQRYTDGKPSSAVKYKLGKVREKKTKPPKTPKESKLP